MTPYMPKIKPALELMPEGEREEYIDVLRYKGGFRKYELVEVIEISKKLTKFTKKFYCCDGDILMVEYEKKGGNPRCINYEVIHKYTKRQDSPEQVLNQLQKEREKALAATKCWDEIGNVILGRATKTSDKDFTYEQGMTVEDIIEVFRGKM